MQNQIHEMVGAAETKNLGHKQDNETYLHFLKKITFKT